MFPANPWTLAAAYFLQTHFFDRIKVWFGRLNVTRFAFDSKKIPIAVIVLNIQNFRSALRAHQVTFYHATSRFQWSVNKQNCWKKTNMKKVLNLILTGNLLVLILSLADLDALSPFSRYWFAFLSVFDLWYTFATSYFFNKVFCLRDSKIKAAVNYQACVKRWQLGSQKYL